MDEVEDIDQLSKEDRAQIRQKLRTLISDAEGKKNSYLSQKASSNIFDTVKRADTLFKYVRNAEDATLDSKTLKIAATVNLQNARDLKVFISKMIVIMSYRLRTFTW